MKEQTKRPNPRYTLEFKQDAAKLVNEKGYVAVVIDLFSRQVVGWAIDGHMRTSLCVSALQMACWRGKPKPGLLHHADRGSQYASHEYR